MSEINWIWPAIALAFSVGVATTRWVYRRIESRKTNQVNRDYFKGLNFVLNEEPDKAIEVFIKALEVDSETVELHLALGGLFRRKGQVDRATRIHQNLIARTSLTEEQRLQAIFELAQDYQKAGLLDRAENLFLELKESLGFRAQAIDGLSNIYQQEKEWHAAIEVLRTHKRADRFKYATRMAHYWCELAEEAITAERYDDAHQFLRSASKEDHTSARAVLLRGDLSYRLSKYERAIELWRGLLADRPDMSEQVVERLISSYRAMDDQAGLTRYLLHEVHIPKSHAAFSLWRDALIILLGEEKALGYVLDAVRREGLTGPVAEYLDQPAQSARLVEQHREILLKDMLSRAKQQKIEYTCSVCGFVTKALYWYCPNCGEWESFS